MAGSLPISGSNPYIDADLATFYAGLGYEGTYQLAVRDLPDVVARRVAGRTALDFACGAGRSTRFLKSLGFDVIGVDISPSMLTEAKRRDPAGTYLKIGDADLSVLGQATFALILCAFPLGNTTSLARMRALLASLHNRLAADGCLIVIDATDDLYRHEWLSFTTIAFAENATAKSGDPVRVSFRDRADQPVTDVLWTDDDYRDAFAAVGLEMLETHRPLARADDPTPWISEREVPPWVIYVLGAV